MLPKRSPPSFIGAQSRHRAQPILERSALLTGHAEGKASLTPMGIYRDRPPMNAITARRQRFEGSAYDVAIDLRLTLIDAHPARIRYVGGAKCGLQSVRKSQRDLTRGF